MTTQTTTLQESVRPQIVVKVEKNGTLTDFHFIMNEDAFYSVKGAVNDVFELSTENLERLQRNIHHCMSEAIAKDENFREPNLIALGFINNVIRVLSACGMWSPFDELREAFDEAEKAYDELWKKQK